MLLTKGISNKCIQPRKVQTQNSKNPHRRSRLARAYLRVRLRQPQVPRQTEANDDQEQRGGEADPECLVWEVGLGGRSRAPILKTCVHTQEPVTGYLNGT